MNIFDELVKEHKKELDRKEEEKIFNAIHRQAYYKRLDDENKAMLKNMSKKMHKKKNTDKITEIIVCSVLAIIPSLFWLWILLNLQQ